MIGKTSQLPGKREKLRELGPAKNSLYQSVIVESA